MLFDLNSLFLIVGLINGLLISSLLVLKPNNNRPNLILAALIFLLVARVTIFILGRNDIYDPHNWLFVPPFEFSLAYGPLIYAYVNKLTKQSLPYFWPHLILFFVQFFYYLMLLVLPQTDTINWIQTTHFNGLVQLETVLVIISMGWYLLLSWRTYVHYQKALKNERSDGENFRLPWLFGFLLASSLSLFLVALFSFTGIWVELNYSQHFWLFASLSLLLFYLSFESWRNSDLELPKISNNSTITNNLESIQTAQINRKAEQWLLMIVENQWWKIPDITLDDLAHKLNSNSSTVSKTLNTGLGKNFSTLINELRVQAVCHDIDQGLTTGHLLKIAFLYGFNSKNSFNRNFKKITGLTPSQYQKSTVPNYK